MAVTKITVSTAMRARDVSRPRAEDLATAAERELAVTRQPAEPPAAPPPAVVRPAPPPAVVTPAAPPAAGQAGLAAPAQPPSRRRRRRGR